MITRSPPHPGVLGVVSDLVGLAVSGHHPYLAADPALGQLLLRALPSLGRSLFEPITMPTRGASTIELLELGLGRRQGLGDGFAFGAS